MRLRALKQLKFSTSRGIVVIEEGQTFKPADPQLLIKSGLAEPVTEMTEPSDPEDLFKILQMPLSEFKKGGYLVRVRCRVLNGQEIYLASSERELQTGKAEGLVCYTADELLNLIKGQPFPEEVRAVHQVKTSLNGVLTEVAEIKESKPVRQRKGVR